MDVIDALGGVDFNVPYDMDYDDPRRIYIYTLRRESSIWTVRRRTIS